MIFGMTMLQQSHPGIMELSMLLQTRQNNHWTRTGWAEDPLTDRQYRHLHRQPLPGDHHQRRHLEQPDGVVDDQGR